MFRIIFISGILLLCNVPQLLAQEVEMADQLRSDGKIYIVIGVILILLIGLFIYMFRIEKEVKRLEEK